MAALRKVATVWVVFVAFLLALPFVLGAPPPSPFANFDLGAPIAQVFILIGSIFPDFTQLTDAQFASIVKFFMFIILFAALNGAARNTIFGPGGDPHNKRIANIVSLSLALMTILVIPNQTFLNITSPWIAILALGIALGLPYILFILAFTKVKDSRLKNLMGAAMCFAAFGIANWMYGQSGLVALTQRAGLAGPISQWVFELSILVFAVGIVIKLIQAILGHDVGERIADAVRGSGGRTNPAAPNLGRQYQHRDPPGQPQNVRIALHGTPLDNNNAQIRITWDAVPNAVRYRVGWRDSNGNSGYHSQNVPASNSPIWTGPTAVNITQEQQALVWAQNQEGYWSDPGYSDLVIPSATPSGPPGPNAAPTASQSVSALFRDLDNRRTDLANAVRNANVRLQQLQQIRTASTFRSSYGLMIIPAELANINAARYIVKDNVRRINRNEFPAFVNAINAVLNHPDFGTLSGSQQQQVMDAAMREIGEQITNMAQLANDYNNLGVYPGEVA